MASGDCVAGLQIHLCDVAIFIRGDFVDRAIVVDGHAISAWHRTVRRRGYSADQCCLDGRPERPRQSQPEKEEDDMKRISAEELECRSEKELCVLFQTVSQDLIRTKRGTPARRNSLGMLENINRVRVTRLAR
jgi:hypothetical protein